MPYFIAYVIWNTLAILATLIPFEKSANTGQDWNCEKYGIDFEDGSWIAGLECYSSDSEFATAFYYSFDPDTNTVSFHWGWYGEIQEDDPEWDCNTMGNRTCGPNPN